MSISITHPKDSPISTEIILRTKHTAYAMGILYGKFPVHLYYGKKTRGMDLSYKSRFRSFAPFYPEYGVSYLPDVALSEFPAFGYGDFRAAAIRLRDLSTGSDATEFIYKTCKKHKGRLPLSAPVFGELPYAAATSDTETLEVLLVDPVTECELHLYYTVFPSHDVIARHMTIINKGGSAVRLEKCMSLCLDIPREGLSVMGVTAKKNISFGKRRQLLLVINMPVRQIYGALTRR